VKTILAPQATVTTQMVLASALLRLSGEEAEQAIKAELAENPALELLEPGLSVKRAGREPARGPDDSFRGQDGGFHKSAGNRWDEDGEDPLERVVSAASPLDQLLAQARLIAPSGDIDLVTHLIHALDRHGFLSKEETELAAELGVSRERVLEGIAWLQTLDPPGIGARNLRECFLLQCSHLAALGVDCSAARAILDDAWDCLARQRWECVAKRAGMTHAQVDDAIHFIAANLYPYPLSLVPDPPERTRTLSRPDLVVRRDADSSHYRAEVVTPETYRLRISDTFRASAADRSDVSPLTPAENEWILQARERARRFIDAVEQRIVTLNRVATYVVTYQHGFFEHGPAFLQPLTRAAVATALGLHESTVSRAVNGKVLQMPDGRLIEFSDLFDRSLAAKEVIRVLIRSSGRNWSDREIAAELQKQSLCVARRTVAKYRGCLGIPGVAHRQRMQH
jgi:RNA polymerase sigma-54 factor